MDMAKDCMVCNKHIGHRGFCSKKCHDDFYDGLIALGLSKEQEE